MRGALAVTVVGLYMGSLHLASHNPLFYDLSILLAGIVLGVAAHDCIQKFPKPQAPDPTPELSKTFQQRMLDKNPEKARMVLKLRQMLETKICSHRPYLWFYSREAKDYVKELGPEVLDLCDEALWTVVNEGEDYAFRNPTDTRRTIVMRKEFAEKALVLGYFP